MAGELTVRSSVRASIFLTAVIRATGWGSRDLLSVPRAAAVVPALSTAASDRQARRAQLTRRARPVKELTADGMG
ncbi:hypothetical protein ABZX90_04880 [Streptomyces sp. NPDC002935]